MLSSEKTKGMIAATQKGRHDFHESLVIGAEGTSHMTFTRREGETNDTFQKRIDKASSAYRGQINARVVRIPRGLDAK